MARATFVRRHRVGIASAAALVIAAGAVVVYAATAEGYKKHEAELNDGGVWVVNGKLGWSGRMNRPINQLDGVVPSPEGKARLDVVQDGASVVTLNVDASRGQSIETSRLEAQDGGSAAIPAGGEVRMAGGTLASADTETGEVWAVRYDAEVGKPVMSAVDRQADALADAGGGASLAVSQEGTVVVASAADGTVTTVAPAGAGFGEPRTRDLPGDAGQVSGVTTVGERVVTLDGAAGIVRVADGGAVASVPAGSLLQQSGPAADAVLVGGPDGLYAVDLDSGEVTTIGTASGNAVEPVRLGACVFGAWSGGQGAVAVQCGSEEARVNDLGGDATRLAFRVNRGEIVLNDAPSGTVWDVQQDSPVRIDTWEAFTSKKKKDDEEDQNDDQTQADRRPPQAKPDSYGVRAGRTTVLHPLDNDSAPEGRLLSIVDVDQPGGGARVEISPDGQTLVLEMPEEARPATFDYFIDDGRDGLSAHASVTVAVRADGENQPPELREGYEKPTYQVPHSGAIAVPVLADWRDDADGDTLLLDSARAVGGEESGAVARTTSDGRIRFSAPTGPADGPQLVRVELGVTDGRSAPVRRSISFQVQAPRDRKTFPPSAEPDVVRGEVGKPIKIRPLLNDLPGSDPTTPNAELALGGKVPQQPGATIVSDLDSGQLTFTGDRPGTYFLTYDAAYGDADLDQGTIRVDVKPRPKRAADPIAMPDTLTVYGQAPGIVDVLANDLDPAGGLLVVQRATADQDDQLDVAIVDGRWLRISSVQPTMTPRTQTVSYSISNGSNSGVRGEVVVTQRPEPADNTPITAPDRVVVRAGTAVVAPVLDNDVSPSGDRLTLLSDVTDSAGPGQLDVIAPVDVTGDVGKAFVSGRVVRYVAPEQVEERDTYEVTYVAQNLDGQRATGVLRVTVVPADDPNDPPEPPTLEGRVVSADTVKVRVPGVGVDRDGDPVTVTGITSAPRLGRIVSFGGNFLEYQAYPRTVGTDEFTYSVVDSQGAFATGTVRIAVVEPVGSQPPLAVADRLTVAPGRTATFDPIANDFIASGDSVQVKLLDAPGSARLDPETNLVTVPAPGSVDDPPVVIVYEVTNGLSSSRATMTLETVEGYNNPPIVYDAFGRAEDSGSVVVDVLEGAYDPDGPVEDLVVSDVSGDPSATIVDASQIRADRGPSPKVLPFEVRDADGAAAVASVYIPPTGDGLPYVLPDALVELDQGASVTGDIADYVAAPDGAVVRLASGRRSYSASPSALSVGPDGDDRFTLSASPGFRGPGALLVEVTTARERSGNEDASTTDDGVTAVLSIPVQVGDDKPTLECPSTVVPISAGQAIDLDIASFCTVFTVDPRDAAGLSYDAGWSQGLSGLGVGSPVGAVVPITAAESATEGGDAVLEVRAGDSNTQEVRFRLAQAPAPRLLPIRVETMQAGQTRTIDVGAYLEAGVADPTPTIVSVDSFGNPGVRASIDGSRLTLAAAKDARGVQAGFRLVVSDVASSDAPASRRAEGEIRFQVVGRPATPGVPRPWQDPNEVGAIKMSWTPPEDDGGAPILRYVVREERSGDQRTCDTTQCVFRGLEGTRRYSFRVKAVNRVGESDWSDLSQSATADTKPGRVRNVRMAGRGDGTITLAWDKPVDSASAIERYLVTWAGGSAEVLGGATSYQAVGLNNNQRYVFTIRAENKVGLSLPRQSDELQSLGTPAAPAAPTVTNLETGANQTDVRITWQGVQPEGPGPTTYTVVYSTGQASQTVPGCLRIQSLTCTHANLAYNGLTYTYRVIAGNQPSGEPAHRSTPSEGASVSLVGRPAAWADWSWTATGVSQEIQLSFTVPDSRGSSSNVAVLVGGVVARELPNTTGAVTTKVSMPGNDLSYPVELRVCNEKAPAGCTLSGAKQAQSYGPLNNAITDVRPVVNGKDVYWVVTGTANGAPVVVRYLVDGQSVQEVRPGVTGVFSFQTQTYTTAKHRDLIHVNVVVFDESRPGRGSDSADSTTRAGDPPPPALSVVRGQLCGDLPGTTRNCRENISETPCVYNSCSTIRIVTSGFFENYRCYASGSVLNPSGGNPGEINANHPEGLETRWYAPGDTVTITCTDITGYQTATASVSWPVQSQ